jgi:hypothetical protein
MTLAVLANVSVDTAQIAAAIGDEFMETLPSLSMKPLASEVTKVRPFICGEIHPRNKI